MWVNNSKKQGLTKILILLTFAGVIICGKQKLWSLKRLEPEFNALIRHKNLNSRVILSQIGVPLDGLKEGGNASGARLTNNEARDLIKKGYNVIRVEGHYDGLEEHLKRVENNVPWSGGYHTNDELQEFLVNLELQYPSMAFLERIGQSVRGNPIWCLKITNGEALSKPEFAYIANIHGDEVIGRELVLKFAKYILETYQNDTRIRNIVDNTRIYLVPSLNPDGFHRGTRYNTNGIDLNRDFPDPLFPRPNAVKQPETRTIMEWANKHRFVIAANFHGGAVVANYPWDGNKEAQNGLYSSTPDDSLYIALARAYANNNPGMSGSTQFNGGITNGAAWYVLYGGLQDYLYHNHGAMSLTLEVSERKWPPASHIPTYWNANKEAMLHLTEWVGRGISGKIVSAQDKNPIEAKVMVGHKMPVYSDPETGRYHRILLPGTYTIRISAPGFKTELRRHFHFSRRDKNLVLNFSLDPEDVSS